MGLDYVTYGITFNLLITKDKNITCILYISFELSNMEYLNILPVVGLIFNINSLNTLIVGIIISLLLTNLLIIPNLIN